MNNSVEIIRKLFFQFKNNEYVIKKLEEKIANTLPIEVLSWKYESEKRHDKSMMNTFVNDFFNTDITYYYSKKQDMFIVYDGKDYKVISEDNLLFEILEKISKIKELHEKKQEIKDIIINKIKLNKLDNSIPESITIQTIITYLYPGIFKTKAESKYFLCILGDNILKKNRGKYNFIINEKSNKFISHIADCYHDYFQNKDIINNFNLNFHKQRKNRLIDFNLNVDNEYYWKFFIDHFILNLVVVSIHYSHRYDDSETYLKNKIQNKNKILILDDYKETIENNNSLLDYFYKLYISNENDKTISSEEMYYIWCLFLSNENIPNIFNEAKIKKYLAKFLKEKKNVLEEGNIYKNVTNDKIIMLREFSNFWDNFVHINMNEELEISELKYLFTNKFNKNCSEEDIKQILFLKYNIYLKNNKTAQGYSCTLWNKKKTIRNVIKNCNVEATSDYLALYKCYCKYLKKKENDLIVSKSYFLKNIKQIIKEYLNNS